eukprot:2171045-Rhodomonas_salina.1
MSWSTSVSRPRQLCLACTLLRITIPSRYVTLFSHRRLAFHGHGCGVFTVKQREYWLGRVTLAESENVLVSQCTPGKRREWRTEDGPGTEEEAGTREEAGLKREEVLRGQEGGLRGERRAEGWSD